MPMNHYKIPYPKLIVLLAMYIYGLLQQAQGDVCVLIIRKLGLQAGLLCHSFPRRAIDCSSMSSSVV